MKMVHCKRIGVKLIAPLMLCQNDIVLAIGGALDHQNFGCKHWQNMNGKHWV